MSFNAQQLKITYGFTVAGTEEIALTTLRFSSGAGWTGAAAALAELDSTDGGLLASAMGVLMSTPALHWADYSEFRSVRVDALAASGAQLLPAFLFDVGLIDQGTEDNVPPQCSIVMSTLTVNSFGPGARGRMYLPHCRWAYDDQTVTPTTGSISSVAAAGSTFIGDTTDVLNAALSDTVAPAIMGSVTTANPTGSQREITRVSVGSVTDTQRRRRNALPETYSIAAV